MLVLGYADDGLGGTWAVWDGFGDLVFTGSRLQCLEYMGCWE